MRDHPARIRRRSTIRSCPLESSSGIPSPVMALDSRIASRPLAQISNPVVTNGCAFRSSDALPGQTWQDQQPFPVPPPVIPTACRLALTRRMDRSPGAVVQRNSIPRWYRSTPRSGCTGPLARRRCIRRVRSPGAATPLTFMQRAGRRDQTARTTHVHQPHRYLSSEHRHQIVRPQDEANGIHYAISGLVGVSASDPRFD